MNEISKICFIIPVYNVINYLDECINSIKIQEFQDWSIILIDDCSNDGSSELCDKIANSDKRISVFHNEENIGPGASRNIGLENCFSEYVFFLDGDDTIEFGSLSKLWIMILKTNYPDIIKVGYKENFGKISQKNFPNDFQSDSEIQSIKSFLLPFLEKDRIGFRAWEFVYKRELLFMNNIRFGSSFIWEDNDFTIKCLFSSSGIAHFNNTFYIWRIRLNGSLTSAHSERWYDILDSAISMIEFYSDTLKNYQKLWIIKSVRSCIYEFEAIAGSISEESLNLHIKLFSTLKKKSYILKEYSYRNGLIEYLELYDFDVAAKKLINYKKSHALKLCEGKEKKAIYGFPATRKCVRLINILKQNNFCVIGMFDNDEKKQNLVLDNFKIFDPAFLKDEKLKDNIFIIITTSTEKTGMILAQQLIDYGFIEKRHFICTGFDEE